LESKYNNDGRIREIIVDGSTWAAYEYTQDEPRMTVHYNNGYTESSTYNAQGKLIESMVQKKSNDPETGPEPEKVSFSYNKSGALTAITGIDGPLVNISYKDDNKPLKVTTPFTAINYAYDSAGHMKQISSSQGITAAYLYQDNDLSQLQIDNQGQRAEYILDNNQRIIHSRDLLGNSADYNYHKGRLSSVKTRDGEATYVYDDQNRLQEMRFPDGSWIEYRYETQKQLTRNKTKSLPTRTITVITHPRVGSSVKPSLIKGKQSRPDSNHY
jgi:YD repeat-containing protein